MATPTSKPSKYCESSKTRKYNEACGSFAKIVIFVGLKSYYMKRYGILLIASFMVMVTAAAKEKDPNADAVLDSVRVNRITSYNVCYTKLLRRHTYVELARNNPVDRAVQTE